ncbi:MAG: lysozyme inhibitor LprI family protein [Bacteroidota bacterium]
MRRFLLCFAFALICKGAFAQAIENKHEIDIQLQKCLDSTANQTTVGMIDCTRRAMDAWDSELNKYYKQLMNILSEEEKEKLKLAQQKWLLYRDTEISLAGTVFNNLQGTIWRIVAAERQMDIVKQRALGLKSYYETLKDEK